MSRGGRRRPVPDDPRIIHGPANVADQGPALAEEQRRLGADAVSFEVGPHPFYPPADVTARHDPRDQLDRAVAQSWGFFRMAQDYDVVHLHWSSFLPPIPWPVPRPVEAAYLTMVAGQLRHLRRRGKLLVAHFHGDDVRPIAEIAAEWLEPDPVLALSAYDAQRRAARVRYSRVIARECQQVFVSTPDLLPHVPGSRLLPVVPSRPFARGLGGREPRSPTDELRIVHAPSDATVKGSALIQKSVEAVRARGVALSWTVLEGQRVEEVLRCVMESDLLIDQLNLGWYGVLAVESMSRGVPVIARLSGRNQRIFRESVPDVPRGGPISVESGKDLEVMIERLAALAGSDGLKDLSESASGYALQVHDGVTIARRLLDSYETGLRTGCAL